MKRFLIVLIACFCFFMAGLAPSNSSASIIASYSGSSWSTEEQGVVAAAVSAWSSLLDIAQNLTITFSLADLSGGTLGSTTITSASGAKLPTSASITIDTGSWISWNLSSIASSSYDALTLIEHEIGHALGIAYLSSLLYYDAVQYISGYYYIEGYKIYYSGNNSSSNINLMSHLADSSDLMYPYLNSGVRIGISDADVDILSDVYGYTVASAVPLPASLLLFVPGLAGLFAARKRLFA
jgi:hypothetical protein